MVFAWLEWLVPAAPWLLIIGGALLAAQKMTEKLPLVGTKMPIVGSGKGLVGVLSVVAGIIILMA